MHINEDISYDEVIIGSPKKIKDITFIPVYDVNFASVKLLGTFFAASINPKALIIIDKNGEIQFLQT